MNLLSLHDSQSRCVRFFLFCAVGIGSASTFGTPAHAETVLYSNGWIWNGENFEQRDLITLDGLITLSAEPDRIVDLAGRYVVPAYANAHAHITNPTRETSDYFLQSGVFYVWNPGQLPFNEAGREFFSRSDTYNVRVANGAITEPGGHPERLYVDILTRFAFPGKDLEYFLGKAFYYGRTEAEIDQALDSLVSEETDFVKSMLLFSEEYDLRRDDPAFYGMRGINPENAPYLVAAAGRRGLLVAFHVETAHDLLVAARSGAAMAAHLPGYGDKASADDLLSIVLSVEQADEIGHSGMIIVPTYSVAVRTYTSSANTDWRLMGLQQAVQVQNLQLLQNAGARFAIGTDQEGEIFTETEYLADLGVFDTIELLQIVFGTGPMLFPDRRIGCFEVACEADFLVLEANPISDIRALRRLVFSVKAGYEVSQPSPIDSAAE